MSVIVKIVIWLSYVSEKAGNEKMMFLWMACSLCAGLITRAERMTLKIYENYHSISLTYYNIPVDVEALSFYFIPYANKINCPIKNIDIYVQYGKYPFIHENLSNYQYISQVEQRYSVKMSAPLVNFYSSPLTISHPNNGIWYVAALIPKEILKIKQKGLYSSCIYLLNVSHAWTKFIVKQLMPNCPFGDRIKFNITTIYKVHVPTITWKFKLVISLTNNISVKNEASSILSAEILLSDHLITSKTIENDTGVIEKLHCSFAYQSNTTCIIEKVFPKTDSFYYAALKFGSIQNELDVNDTIPGFNILYLVETIHSFTAGIQCESSCLFSIILHIIDGLACQNRAIFEDHQYHPLLQIYEANLENANESTITNNRIGERKNDVNYTKRNQSMPLHKSTASRSVNDDPGSDVCPAVVVPLERVHMKQHFTDYFVLKYGYMQLDTISITPDPLLLTFTLDDYVDNGATLVVEIDSQTSNVDANDKDILVVGCLAYRQIPHLNFSGVPDSFNLSVQCEPSQTSYPLVILNGGKGKDFAYQNFQVPQRRLSMSNVRQYDRLIIPYPTTGRWFVYLKAYCLKKYREDGDIKSANELMADMICDEDDALLTFKIRTEPCVTNYEGVFKNEEVVDDKKSGENVQVFNPKICGGKMRGRCHISTQRKILITGCQCIAGWEGLACDNGRRAISRKRQILYVALLTTSNLMFVPVILYSLSIRLYSEAAIYSLNMAASIFYHSCDEAVFKYCMLSYESLQYMDFYTSVLSMVVTVNALSALRYKVHSLMNMASAVVVAFLVQINRLDLWTFMGPLVVSGLVMLASWVWKSFTTRSLYPPNNVIIKRLVPGICLAFVGLLIYLYAQTEDNYAYIHSLWHMMMAASILILLSGKKLDAKVAQSMIQIPPYDNIEESLRVPVPTSQ